MRRSQDTKQSRPFVSGTTYNGETLITYSGYRMSDDIGLELEALQYCGSKSAVMKTDQLERDPQKAGLITLDRWRSTENLIKPIRAGLLALGRSRRIR